MQERTFEFINEARNNNGRVLIASDRGISRCAAVCVAYMVQWLNISLRDAFGIIKDSYRRAKPNAFFVDQLKKTYGHFPIEVKEAATDDIDDEAEEEEDSNDVQVTKKLESKSVETKPFELQSSAVNGSTAMTATTTTTTTTMTTTTTSHTESANNVEEAVDTGDGDEEAESMRTAYFSCRLCRRVLFRFKDIYRHKDMEGQRDRFEGKSFWTRVAPDEACRTYFIKQMDWMKLEGFV
jgi:hypothetical protein